MLTAEQALKLAKPKLKEEQAAEAVRQQDAREAQLKDILVRIQRAAEESEVSLTVEDLRLDVEADLLKLGYTVSYHEMGYRIKWSNPNPTFNPKTKWFEKLCNILDALNDSIRST